MTDPDRLSRDLDDLRAQIREQGYRIRELERMQKMMLNVAEAAVLVGGIPATGPSDVSGPGAAERGAPMMKRMAGPNPLRVVTSSQPYTAPEGVAVTSHNAQFCQCGRDLCRAPDCPSHADPLGR